MRKILVLITTGLLVLALSAGAAWAKQGDANKLKAKVKVKAMQMYKAKYKESAKNPIYKSPKFKDTDNHWAKDSIQRMTMLGLFAGYEDGMFKPNNNISQAEMIALLMRLVDAGNDDDEEVDENELYKVPVWARDSVRNAVKLKIMSLNRFHSAEQASRAQTCIAFGKILVREGYLDLDDFVPDPDNLPFTDGKLLLQNDDLVYILAMYRAGYIKGAPGNKFLPNNAITRAEMAAILERILADLDKEDDKADKDDLSDLESELRDDYDAIGDVPVDDIKLDGDEYEVDVNIEVDLDDYEDEWADLDDSDIKDWLEDLAGDIQEELSRYTKVNGEMINIDNDDVLVEFSKNGTRSLSVSYKDEGYRGDYDDVDDVENELKGDRFIVGDIEFKITSINYYESDDEILVYLKAQEDDASEQWNDLDNDDIEDDVKYTCAEIAEAFQDHAGADAVMVYSLFYDENSHLLESFKFDVIDESLDY